MSVVLAILAGILGLASLLLTAVVPIGAFLANRRLVLQDVDCHVSGTPIVGSIIGFLAIVLVPIGRLGDRLAWSWLPLAVEVTILGISVAYWNLSGLGDKAERQRQSRRR